MEIGNALFDQQRYKEALEIFDHILAQEPLHVEGLMMRGITKHALLDIDGALIDLDRAIELDGRHDNAYYNRALIKEEQGDFAAAKIDVECAIACYHGDSYEYLAAAFDLSQRLKHYEDIEFYMRKLARLEPDMLGIDDNIGLAKLGQGAYEDALPYLNRALSQRPTHAIAYNNVGYAYCMLKEYNKAIPYFNTAIKYDPEFAYAYANRGQAKFELGGVDIALNDIEYSLELDPGNGDAYHTRARIHLALGNKEQAQADFALAETLGHEWPNLADKGLTADK